MPVVALMSASPGGIVCERRDDCPAGERCDDGYCDGFLDVQTCASDADCVGACGSDGTCEDFVGGHCAPSSAYTCTDVGESPDLPGAVDFFAEFFTDWGTWPGGSDLGCPINLGVNLLFNGVPLGIGELSIAERDLHGAAYPALIVPLSIPAGARPLSVSGFRDERLDVAEDHDTATDSRRSRSTEQYCPGVMNRYLDRVETWLGVDTIEAEGDWSNGAGRRRDIILPGGAEVEVAFVVRPGSEALALADPTAADGNVVRRAPGVDIIPLVSVRFPEGITLERFPETGKWDRGNISALLKRVQEIAEFLVWFDDTLEEFWDVGGHIPEEIPEYVDMIEPLRAAVFDGRLEGAILALLEDTIECALAGQTARGTPCEDDEPSEGDDEPALQEVADLLAEQYEALIMNQLGVQVRDDDESAGASSTVSEWVTCGGRPPVTRRTQTTELWTVADIWTGEEGDLAASVTPTDGGARQATSAGFAFLDCSDEGCPSDLHPDPISCGNQVCDPGERPGNANHCIGDCDYGDTNTPGLATFEQCARLFARNGNSLAALPWYCFDANCGDGYCSAFEETSGLCRDWRTAPEFPKHDCIFFMDWCSGAEDDRCNQAFADYCAATIDRFPGVGDCHIQGVTDAPYCGDGSCSDGETCGNCARDCDVCQTLAPFCGDGHCDLDFVVDRTGSDPVVQRRIDCPSCTEVFEDMATCPADCGEFDTCGNGVCEPGETRRNCRLDCPHDCGDGVCGTVETVENCDCDCSCGDGVCSPGEVCEADCSTCGDGVCGSCDPVEESTILEEVPVACPWACPALCEPGDLHGCCVVEGDQACCVDQGVVTATCENVCGFTFRDSVAGSQGCERACAPGQSGDCCMHEPNAPVAYCADRTDSCRDREDESEYCSMDCPMPGIGVEECGDGICDETIGEAGTMRFQKHLLVQPSDPDTVVAVQIDVLIERGTTEVRRSFTGVNLAEATQAMATYFHVQVGEWGSSPSFYLILPVRGTVGGGHLRQP